MSHNISISPCSREILYLVVHCSASKETSDFSVESLRHLHVDINHWQDIGYHFYITKDGTIHKCRPISQIGAHVRNFNSKSIGICYEGGLDASGKPKDTRTSAQKESLLVLLNELRLQFPQARIVGHYELGARKACPCFCPSREYSCL